MPEDSFSLKNPKEYILIKGAKMHNLKNIDVAIPKNKLVVVTGLSGSGKSTLVYDTLYAEGQRRYVESLSAYARQFLGKLNKPDVDFIKGISPAIAIEQKVSSKNPRSTIGTSTEIYDYLKLLFTRIGKTYSPISNKEVTKQSVKDVIKYIKSLENNSKLHILSDCKVQSKIILENLISSGFYKISVGGNIRKIEEVLEKTKSYPIEEDCAILIDRVISKENDEANWTRIADSIQTAFNESKGKCTIEVNGGISNTFSNKFELDGIEFKEPTTHLFSFNNPIGACETCEGYGNIMGIDRDLVIPNKSLSVYENAIVCWRGEKMKTWKEDLVMASSHFDFPIHRPYYDLSEDEQDLLWTGNVHFRGLDEFFSYLEEQSYKIQYRVMLSRYRGKTTCNTCRGSRLKKEANYIKIHDKNISHIVKMSIGDAVAFFDNVESVLNDFDKQVAKNLLLEIRSRLSFLCSVGLSYLNLNRISSTLSGGESQRINLAKSLGSSLVGSTYILDEPSIGLHPRDSLQLIDVMLSLKEIGNSVIVVEHDSEIMKASDHIIDMGPKAGSDGGEVIFEGSHDEMMKETKSLTMKYLSGELEISVPEHRRTWTNHIEIKDARENNLKGLDIKFPLGILTVITGVSGSGKSSLVKKILYPSIKKILGGFAEETGAHGSVEGDIENIQQIEFVDQNPIGKSSRSNPVTYIKAFDEIRDIYSSSSHAKNLGFKPAHFSFNMPGGRCDECEGEGRIKIEMQFMADVFLECETCNGKRFKQEVLDVMFKEKNIADVLGLTIDEAVEFFQQDDKSKTNLKKLVFKLKALQDVGMGYIKLVQSSGTLSGGEAQRIKLASFLIKNKKDIHTLFIFDEPTTGLHFHDVKKLLKAINALVEQGNTVIVIEHNLDVIKSADWLVDLGPEGGDEGGELIFEGLPEDLVSDSESYTGKYLAPLIKLRSET
ncbi:MAG: excinuclease ABC subunit UvrA [Flavobacteriales bacterium]|nr:excinuclease ABC subunit UvrA [Flavobacteriales bacterium]